MTKKRFTITGHRSISDHQKKRLYDVSDFDGVISVTETMNELAEENEQLKQENRRIMENNECTLCTEDNKELEKKYWQLKREKGKLEIEIEILSEELAQAKAVINKEWKKYLEERFNKTENDSTNSRNDKR